MPSLISGYEYDIFISYRQKDNKGDRWVSEFVEALKTELESTFKEEISVYFDINPNDGLLETHDVDASLKEKLKCLVFIPIISRTYCDPKSFAWDHEFKAFIEQASQDQFGLKITLPNGNVANRLLPVRINDLDIADIKLLESILGGILRGVDFIYKSAGVNRPLRSKEDNPHDNLNHTIYRDQINKVALAVKDIIESMKAPVSASKEKDKRIAKKESEEKKEIKVEEPDVKETTKSKQKIWAEITKNKRSFLLIKNPGILISIILGTLIILSSLAFFLYRHSKVKWAREEALPEIERLSNELKMTEAFNLFQKAEKYILQDPKFKELALNVVSRLTILSDPPGADVFIREYSDIDGEWKKLGRTPIDSMKMPNFSVFLMRIEKEGYENVLAVAPTAEDTLYRKLFKEGTIPRDMVYVDDYWDEDKMIAIKKNCGFFLDRYEVTNKQYKEFVDNGGYRKQEYWKNEFIKGGKKISREESMAQFTDKTGRPGPSTWEAGDYPDGQDDYPVTGVSWYEAAAYAEYAGKSLPTGDHWDSGTGFHIPYISNYFGSRIIPLSNFNGKSSEPVGKNQGISYYGAYDMAGNVREWCWNETQIGKINSGAAWNDASYLYLQWNQLPPFNRSPENGFRCAKYIDKDKIPESAFRRIVLGGGRDFSKEKPVPENVFNIYKNQFLYDTTSLESVIEERDESPEDWIIEKISFNAAYGDERMIAYLFLPRNAVLPLQTLIFFPGSYAELEKDLVNRGGVQWFLDFILKSGRAVIYPVYKGTFERNTGPFNDWPNQSHQYTEWLIEWTKDFSRTVDYLETRTDIDTKKLGFYGHSWGGYIGGIIPAVEKRLAVNLLIVGGFGGRAYPEAEAINYVPRIKMPVLMLNGRYDPTFPLESSVVPFYNLLGTSEKDKHLRIYETDHFVPKSEMIKETLNFLDRYLGPVK
jgi:dienelactone hydrolase